MWTQRVRIALIFFTVFFSSSYVVAATTEQLETARNESLAWLIQQQNGDGSWGKTEEEKVRVTSTVLDALAQYNISGLAYRRGVNWLSNAETISIDSLSRKIKTLATVGIYSDADINRLVASATINDDTAVWGALDNHRYGFLDTALAVRALVAVKQRYVTDNADYHKMLVMLDNTADFIYSKRNRGWPFKPYTYAYSSRPSVLPTANIILMFYDLGDRHWKTSYSFYWLADQAKSTYAIADSDDYADVETALSVMALGRTYSLSSNYSLVFSSYENGLDYLLSRQSANGSLSDDIYRTALATQAWFKESQQLTDTDNDGIADVVETEIGTNPDEIDTNYLETGNGNNNFDIAQDVVREVPLNLPVNLLLSEYSGTVTIKGVLPSGTHLNANGYLTGTPTQEGSYLFSYQILAASGAQFFGTALINVVQPNSDTDEDGLPLTYEINYPEILSSLDGNDAAQDADNDGLTTLEEYQLTTNPTLNDTDADGLNDGEEVIFNANPLIADTDSDGLNDKQEQDFGSNPTLADTDSDGLTDAQEQTFGSNPTLVDTDSDGLTDAQEQTFGSNPTLADTDSDGLTDQQEQSLGTNPVNTDTDNDGLTDTAELAFGSNPLLPDTDNDGLTDAQEQTFGSSPTLADTDSDGLTDTQEQSFGSNPTVVDTDSDGLTDLQEQTFGSNPTLADTDSDGLTDSQEQSFGSNPTLVDTDGDGLTDAQEQSFGSNPTLADTDNDGLTDAQEQTFGSNPTLADTDGDGLTDAQEQTFGSNPTLADTDGDGLTDAQEQTFGSNPTLADTDGDGLNDAQEQTFGSNPTLADTDGDGLTDPQEQTFGSNPTLADTDGDGLNDKLEQDFGTNPTLTDTDGNGLNDREDFLLVDTDNDGLTDIEEDALGTNPALADTDGDGLNDKAEQDFGSNPTLADTDSDGLTDLQEQTFGSSPTLADTDNDGLTDAQEQSFGSNPTLADTDGDSLNDKAEQDFGSDPTLADTDGDGLTDSQEQTFGSDPTLADTDNDGLTDAQEQTFGSNPTLADTDSDGLTDSQEQTFGSNPTLADTDNDGLTDAQEQTFGSNPTLADTDNDGLTDPQEQTFGTNPTLADTDGDGLTDSQEQTFGSNPTLADTDSDGLTDQQEQTFGSNPTLADTDGDSLTDSQEQTFGSNPTLADTDGDGLTDPQEQSFGSDPTLADTDGDGLTDPQEQTFGSDPTLADTDGDGLTDPQEQTFGSDPTLADTDSDGLTDLQEQNFGTSPTLADTDGDGLTDSQEQTFGSSPILADTDNDGLTDLEEQTFGSDPTLADSDGDGLSDIEEQQYGYDPLLADSNNDGTNDYADWASRDADQDGLTDLEEPTYGTDINIPDTDGDGLLDGEEIVFGSNPLLIDTDDDGLTDQQEKDYGSSPILVDTDNDNFNDSEEYIVGTNLLDNLDKPYIPIKSGNIACEVTEYGDRVWAADSLTNSLGSVLYLPYNQSLSPATPVASDIRRNITSQLYEDPRTVTIVNDEIAVTYKDSDRVVFYQKTPGNPQNLVDILVNPDGIESIFTGKGSQPIASIAYGQWLYVSLYGTGEVIKIDTVSRQIIERLQVGEFPSAMALTNDGQRLLVARYISTHEYAEVYDISTSGSMDFYDADNPSIKINQSLMFPNDNTIGLPNYLRDIVISSDNKRAYIISNKISLKGNNTSSTMNSSTLLELDLENNQPVYDDNLSSGNNLTYLGGGDISSVTILADGKTFAFTWRDKGNTHFYDVDSKAYIYGFSASDSKNMNGMCSTVRSLYRNNGSNPYLLKAEVTYTPEVRLYNGQQAGVVDVNMVNFTEEELQGFEYFQTSRYNTNTAYGYISCASCHDDGGHDGNTWDLLTLGEGLRNTQSLYGIYDNNAPLNWASNIPKAGENEVAIYHFSEHLGLPATAGNIAMDSGQLTQTQIDTAQALTAYLKTLGQDDIALSPYKTEALADNITNGEWLFNSNNCASCHLPVTQQTGNTYDVGTITAESGNSLGQPLTGVRAPALIELWLSAPYFHNGTAETLDDVLTMGNHGQYDLTDLQKQDLITYLKTLDRDDYSSYQQRLSDSLTEDADGDGLTNAEEYEFGSHPLIADYDNDGLNDFEERQVSSSPILADSDGDGITDDQEILLGSNLIVADTDGDGVNDGDEQAAGTSLTTADTDGDGLTDGEENNFNSNPLLADSDNDGVSDFDEAIARTGLNDSSYKPYYAIKSSALTCEFNGTHGRIWAVDKETDTVSVLLADNYEKSYVRTTDIEHEVHWDIVDREYKKPTSVSRVGQYLAVTYRDSDVVAFYSVNSDFSATSNIVDNGSKWLIELDYGDQPIASIAHGNFLYVSLYGSGEVIKVDITSRSIVGRLQVGTTPGSMALTGDGSRLLVVQTVATEDYGQVYDINTLGALSFTNSFQKTLNIGVNSNEYQRVSVLTGIIINSTNQKAYLSGKVSDNDLAYFPNNPGAYEISPSRNIRATIDLINNIELPVGIQTSFSAYQGLELFPDQKWMAFRSERSGIIQSTSSISAALGIVYRFTDSCILPHKMYAKTEDRQIQIVATERMYQAELPSQPIHFFPIYDTSNETRSVEELRGRELFLQVRKTGSNYITPSCSSCHYGNKHDGQTWNLNSFNEGLRNTLPIRSLSANNADQHYWAADLPEPEIDDVRIYHFSKGALNLPASTNGFVSQNSLTAQQLEDALALDAYVKSLGKESLLRSPYKTATPSSDVVDGEELFTFLACESCHKAPVYRDGQLYDVGTITLDSGLSNGEALTGIRAPSLTELWDTAPYFHDGSAKTLDDVFTVGTHAEFGITELEKQKLIAYLLTLDKEDYDGYVMRDPDSSFSIINSPDDVIPGSGGVVGGDNGNSFFIDTGGNNRLVGLGGNDMYIFQGDFGQDMITNAGWQFDDDTIRFAGVTLGDLWFYQYYDDLKIRVIGTDNEVRVRHWFTTDSYRVEQIEVGNATLFVDDVNALVDVMSAYSVPTNSSDIANDPLLDLLLFSYDSISRSLETLDRADTLIGTADNDFLRGYGGNDYLDGQQGDDDIDGGSGNDQIYGRDGNDILRGGSGHDDIFGYAGNDTFYAGEGNDRMVGSDGNDTFIFEGNFGQDRLQQHAYYFDRDHIIFRDKDLEDLWFEYEGNNLLINVLGSDNQLRILYWKSTYRDRRGAITLRNATLLEADILELLDVMSLLPMPSATGEVSDPALLALYDSLKSVPEEEIQRNFGSDIIGSDILDDTLLGYGGNDFLDGMGGNDIIDGGGDDDRVYGRAGNDILRGGAGNDDVVGFEGDDILYAGEGDDFLVGNQGNDTFIFTGDFGYDRVNSYAYGVPDQDTVIFTDVAYSNLWISQSNNGKDLQINVMGTSNYMVVRDWFTPGRNEITEIHAIDGAGGTRILNAVDVISLLQLMQQAANDVPDSLSNLSSADQSAVNTALENAWIAQ